MVNECNWSAYMYLQPIRDMSKTYACSREAICTSLTALLDVSSTSNPKTLAGATVLAVSVWTNLSASTTVDATRKVNSSGVKRGSSWRDMVVGLKQRGWQGVEFVRHSYKDVHGPPTIDGRRW